MKRFFFLMLTVAISLSFFTSVPLRAESAQEKSSLLRSELLRYIQNLRPMAFNFPCEPYPECNTPPMTGDDDPNRPMPRMKIYGQIKRIYQEGLIFYYEGNHRAAYTRFLDAEARVEYIMEALSQNYLDRAEMMLRDAIEKKYPKDDNDMSVTDMDVELGPNTQKRYDIGRTRVAPYEVKRYDPRQAHFMYSLYEIDRNTEYGYKHLGIARSERMKALLVEPKLPPYSPLLDHTARRQRITHYLNAIQYARLAKFNAEMLYRLKYPYDNYAFQNPTGKTENLVNHPAEIPTIAGEQQNWSENPFVIPKNLPPIFDLRVPDKYRADIVDIRNRRYTDEAEVNIKLKYQKEAAARQNAREGKQPADSGKP